MKYKTIAIFVFILFLFSSAAADSTNGCDYIKNIISKYNESLSSQDLKLLSKIIREESKRYNFSPILIAAIIAAESSFRIKATSSRGCVGLMQIKIATGREAAEELGIQWYGLSTLYDPEKNIKVGVFYLRKMIDRFQDLETALIAYNSGPTITEKRLKSKITLSKRYPNRVKGYHKKFSTTDF